MKNINQHSLSKSSFNKFYKISKKKLIVTTVVITALASSSANATGDIATLGVTTDVKHQLNENIGFGSGVVIGAITAGPIGAFVAGVGGIFIAKFINVNDDNEQLNNALAQEQQKQQLSDENTQRQYRAKLQRLERSYQNKLVTLERQKNNSGQLQAENLLMSLQFSTGSSDIAPHYQEQITALAKLLNSAENMKIDLSGYTDLMGEKSLNQTLSQARVESVSALLIAQGVDEKQITTYAFGEESPVVANNDHQVSFYDRRVVLKLHSSSEEEAKQAIQSQMANNN
jgi:sortase system peptidoglycan-associated protein